MLIKGSSARQTERPATPVANSCVEQNRPKQNDSRHLLPNSFLTAPSRPGSQIRENLLNY
jgi:hypothetical protein